MCLREIPYIEVRYNGYNVYSVPCHNSLFVDLGICNISSKMSPVGQSVTRISFPERCVTQVIYVVDTSCEDIQCCHDIAVGSFCFGSWP